MDVRRVAPVTVISGPSGRDTCFLRIYGCVLVGSTPSGVRERNSGETTISRPQCIAPWRHPQRTRSWFNQTRPRTHTVLVVYPSTGIHRARGLTKHHLTTLKLCSLQDPKNTKNIAVTPTCQTLHFTSVSSTSVAIAAILHRDVLQYKTDFGTCFPLYLRAFLT